MSGQNIYLDWLVDVLLAAGCNVQESNITDGWQRRARSSGGFPFAPLGIQWHHTASSASPANDLSYMINGSSDAPIGNLLLDRTGTFWPIAAGASNTAGKGGPVTLSRGTIPVDQGNTQSVAIEAANNGVGEVWPIAQVDAYIAGSNAINAQLGNLPTDLFTHSLGAGDGWTDRKIDPAQSWSVQGHWAPGSVNSSGTWSLADIRAECASRWAGGRPNPEPQPPTPNDEDDDMATFLMRNRETGQIVLLAYDGAGISATGMAAEDLDAYQAKFGGWIDTNPAVFDDLIGKSDR